LVLQKHFLLLASSNGYLTTLVKKLLRALAIELNALLELVEKKPHRKRQQTYCRTSTNVGITQTKQYLRDQERQRG